MKTILKIIIIILILIPLLLGLILVFDNGTLKYSEEITINQSIDIVNTLFEDIYNMKKYMPGTKAIVLISGTDREENANYKITIEAGDQTMDMNAVLKKNNLPDSLQIYYKMPGVLNIMTQRHKKISEEKTLIINEQEFQFKGVMKILAFFQPPGFNLEAFKKQSKIYLVEFKKFTEQQ